MSRIPGGVGAAGISILRIPCKPLLEHVGPSALCIRGRIVQIPLPELTATALVTIGLEEAKALVMWRAKQKGEGLGHKRPDGS